MGQSFGPGDMSADIREVRRLAFYYMPCMLLPRLDSRYLWGILEAFGNLEEVILVFWSSFRGERHFLVGGEEEMRVVEPVMAGEYIRDIYAMPYSLTEDKLLVRLRTADELWKLNTQIEDVRGMHKEMKAGWKLPGIELKSLVTKGFWEWFDKEGRGYEDMKERFRMHLTLRTPGMEPLMMDAREDMSIANVVSVFREEGNISDEVAVFNGSGNELIQSTTFYEPEFFRHRPDFEVELTVSVWKTFVEDPVIMDWMRLIDPINSL
jgi:hypothetical protein